MVVAELYYFTIRVPDGDRGRRFYEALFGWQFEASPAPDAWHIANIQPPGALHGGAPEPSQDGTQVPIALYFAVDDVAAAVGRVRELGGEASEPAEGVSGSWAECVDDQGTPFMIGWLRPEMR